uniref:Uncharacterized protein n=1 Tax=Klebsiella pneumoniae TaxID=573 RepID=A0A6M3HGF4_KLEPN|nr:hypothetical protein [Klebsiella pneumoniae]
MQPDGVPFAGSRANCGLWRHKSAVVSFDSPFRLCSEGECSRLRRSACFYPRCAAGLPARCASHTLTGIKKRDGYHVFCGFSSKNPCEYRTYAVLLSHRKGIDPNHHSPTRAGAKNEIHLKSHLSSHF